MHKIFLGLGLTVLFAGAATAQQKSLPDTIREAAKGAQTTVISKNQSLQITEEEKQAVIKAYPAGTRRGTLMKSADTGDAIVAFYLDSIKQGKDEQHDNRGLAHPDIIEIYVVLKGSATQVSGGKMTNAADVPQSGSPTWFGKVEGGTAQTIKAGDIVLNPPGTIHYWKSFDTPEFIYMNIWIDAKKKIPAGALDDVLKKMAAKK
jgi:mannose-6-phosphate isomerase-like protein (cupin superfamily)